MLLKECPDCGHKVSDEAVWCPGCGRRGPKAGHPKPGIDYRSAATLMGWPLLHVATGVDPETGNRRVAMGVVALGNTAVGLVAIGGIAIGGIAMGGLSLGLFSLGGIAAGVLVACGGVAFGGVAVGGVAVGIVAIGGVAVGFHAIGGVVAGERLPRLTTNNLETFGQQLRRLFSTWR